MSQVSQPRDEPLFPELETEPPATTEVLRARVVLDEPVGVLDYRIPDDVSGQIEPGVAVRVRLRNRRTSAYVAEVVRGPAPDGITLKAIDAVDTERPPIPGDMMALVLFAADYYGVFPGDLLAAALPAMARRPVRRYHISDSGTAMVQPDSGAQLRDDDRRLLEFASTRKDGVTAITAAAHLGVERRKAAARLRSLAARELLLARQRRAGRRRTILYRRIASPDDADRLLSKRQQATREVFDAITADAPTPAATIAGRFKGAYGKLKTLKKLGLVERLEHNEVVKPLHFDVQEAIPTPTAMQAAAIDTLRDNLDAGKFATFMLKGVTGSGKTEVYLRLIEHALSCGRTALVLVPEIALTPQLGARFRSRFGERVATFHSGLTVAERRDEWDRIASGQAVIGLGARSALFLPLRGLGVIVVDEEHDASFKQEEAPRYNARDLAVFRGRQNAATVVLGSATPSLETAHNATAGRYATIELPERVGNRALPTVQCIDMRKAARVGDGIFSAPLARAVERRLFLGDQAILFLNRRGFAPYVFCRDCGVPFRCDDCDVSLTLHRRRDVLLCHYCDFETATPEECPNCHGLNLEAQGLGTERLETEIGSLFGTVNVARLDRDRVKNRSDLLREIERFRSGEARLLIGTQMVTKGHDFPGVTLVGVVAADASLNFPDFRAAERTFQLLTQVAGRAGRGDKSGEVLVQTYETDHHAIRTAAAHDHDAFAAHELTARRELRYPPFSHLVLLRYEGPDEAAVRDKARANAAVLKEKARSAHQPVSVLGPAPAPLSRLRGRWRFHILLKGQMRAALRTVLTSLPRNTADDGVRRIVDVDPVNML